ncbi:hypothetical protein CERSUDRAFT_115092 [Gelatoporia subvermispora B]|uniref:Thioesterase domain-containing protein n=1 Tax=Ceriporiopsis subvermispora (strain B) TaxID=914234 RepID=M2QYE3_CERS8|nr:hypothetical protein CERSUDRAFT_115092 [Gelatoporia subvermispora B]
MTVLGSKLATPTAWVDPEQLPKVGDASSISGNAPDYVKQVTLSTLHVYGVGPKGCFGASVGDKIRIVEVNIEKRGRRQESSAVCEVTVTEDMLNSAGVMHGGCVGYLVDLCAAVPLVALGVAKKSNGAGVTQALNILFHAPAAHNSCLRITSNSITLGGRLMTSRCEIVDKDSGRAIASAFLSKMQPVMTKM